MDIILKDYPVTGGGITDAHPSGEFEVILSAPTLDRDGEHVDSKAFDPLPDHITFDTDHSMTCDSVVGSGVPFYDEAGLLKVKGTFASDERSQVIRQKVADGHIRTTSVAFMAADREKDDKGVEHVVKAELLNGTFTPVPANRESLVLTAKSIVAHEVAGKVGARNNKTDMEHIQAVHDSAAHLGAACAAKTVGQAEAKSTTDDDPGDDVAAEVVPPDVDSTDSDAAAEAADPAAQAAGSAADAAADEKEQRDALAAAIENVRLATFGR